MGILIRFPFADDGLSQHIDRKGNIGIGYSFGGITTAAEGLFTVLAGAGMAAFARHTMTSVAATGRMARRYRSGWERSMMIPEFDRNFIRSSPIAHHGI